MEVQRPWQLTSLSYKDFDAVPGNIADYTLGSQLTRENWVPFIITSFSKSRGVPIAQSIWLDYAAAKSGANWVASLEAFLAPHGQEPLTEVEQELIRQAFRRITVEGHAQQPDEDILVLFRDNLEALAMFVEDDTAHSYTREQLCQMNSSEIGTLLNETITTFKERARQSSDTQAE